MNNLLNDENLSQLTQQSADILEPILQFNIFLSTFFILLILLKQLMFLTVVQSTVLWRVKSSNLIGLKTISIPGIF